MIAFEKTVTIDQDGLLMVQAGSQLQNKKVRVLILVEDDFDNDNTWVNSIGGNEVFDFLKDECEDIYTIEDGKSMRNEI